MQKFRQIPLQPLCRSNRKGSQIDDSSGGQTPERIHRWMSSRAQVSPPAKSKAVWSIWTASQVTCQHRPPLCALLCLHNMLRCIPLPQLATRLSTWSRQPRRQGAWNPRLQLLGFHKRHSIRRKIRRQQWKSAQVRNCQRRLVTVGGACENREQMLILQ